MYRGNKPPSDNKGRGRGRPQPRGQHPQRFQNPQQQQNFPGGHRGQMQGQNHHQPRDFNSPCNAARQSHPPGRYESPRRSAMQYPEQRYRDPSSASSYHPNVRGDYYPDFASESPGAIYENQVKASSAAPPVGDFTEDVIEETFNEYPPLINSSEVHNGDERNPEKNKNEAADQPPLDAFVSRLLDSFDSDEDDEFAGRRRHVPVSLPPPPKGILKKSTSAAPVMTVIDVPDSGGTPPPGRIVPRSINTMIHKIREKTSVEKEIKETGNSGETVSRIEVLTSQRQKTETVHQKLTNVTAPQPLMASALTGAAVIAASGATLQAFRALPLTNLQHALDDLRRGHFEPQHPNPQRERDLEVAVQEFLDKGKSHLPLEKHPAEAPPSRRSLEREPSRPMLRDESMFIQREQIRREEMSLRREEPIRREGPPLRREEPPLRREDLPARREELPFRRNEPVYRREELIPRRSPSPFCRTRSFNEPPYDDFHREQVLEREQFQRSAGPHRSPLRRHMGSPGRDWPVDHDRDFRVVRNLNDDYPDRPRRLPSVEIDRRFSRSPQLPGSRSRDWEDYDHPPPKRLRSQSPRSFSPVRRRRISPLPPNRDFASPPRSRSPYFDDYNRRRHSPPPELLPHPLEVRPPPPMGILPNPGASLLLSPSIVLPTQPTLLSLPLGAPAPVTQGMLPTPEVRRQVRRGDISPPAGRNVVLRERSPSPWEDRPVTPVRAEMHSNPPAAAPPPERTAVTAESKEEEEKRKGFLLQRKKHMAKQQKLINELFRLQTQQADLVMKQTRAVADREISRHGQLIVENAKLQKGVTLQIQTLQKVITRLESGLKGTDFKDSIELPSNPSYAYFDPEQHWCSTCDTFYATLKDYLLHKHTKLHQLKVTGAKSTPWKAALKEEQEKQAKAAAEQSKKILVPVHGLDFLRPVKAWYCELCDQWLGDLECANIHLNSTVHNDKYLKHILDHPEMEATHAMKRQLGFQRHLERRKEERAGKAKKEEEEKAKRKEELQKNWEEFIQKEQRRNQNVTELDDCQEKKSAATPAGTPESSGAKSIRVNMRNLSGKTESQAAEAKAAAGNDIFEWTAQPANEDLVDKQALETLREKIKKKQPPSQPATNPSGSSSSTTLKQEDRIEKTSSMPLGAKPAQQPGPRAPVTLAEVKKAAPTASAAANSQTMAKPAPKMLPTVGRIPSKRAQEIKVATEDFIVLSEFNASSDEETDQKRQSEVVEVDLT